MHFMCMYQPAKEPNINTNNDQNKINVCEVRPQSLLVPFFKESDLDLRFAQAQSESPGQTVENKQMKSVEFYVIYVTNGNSEPQDQTDCICDVWF